MKLEEANGKVMKAIDIFTAAIKYLKVKFVNPRVRQFLMPVLHNDVHINCLLKAPTTY